VVVNQAKLDAVLKDIADVFELVDTDVNPAVCTAEGGVGAKSHK
jgi:hypothetical protein